MEDTRNKVSKKLKTLLVIAILFILLLLIVFFAFGLNESVEKSIKKTVTNIIFQTNVSCKSGEKMMGINEDGTIKCEFDLLGGGGGGGGGGGIASESDPYWIASYSLFNDSWSYTFNQTTNNSLNNYINSVGKFYPLLINLTAGTYNGSLVNGTTIGYSAGNSICNKEFIRSHLCNEFEITSWFANTNNVNLQNNTDFWIIAGGPKYVGSGVIPDNDCNAFTYSGTVNYVGNYWHFNNKTGGDGRAINCGTTLNLACCSY